MQLVPSGIGLNRGTYPVNASMDSEVDSLQLSEAEKVQGHIKVICLGNGAKEETNETPQQKAGSTQTVKTLHPRWN